MKVQGMVNPGSFTVEEIPGTKRSLVRLYQNVEACKIAKDAEDKEGLDGFQYDEYCVEVESWPDLLPACGRTTTPTLQRVRTMRSTAVTMRCSALRKHRLHRPGYGRDERGSRIPTDPA